MNEATEITEEQEVSERLNIKPEFHVTDESSADWVLRKVREARDGRKHVEAQLAAKIEAYRKEEEYLIMRYQAELEQFARQQLDGAKSKTLKLAEGNLSFRKKPAQLVVHSHQATMAWAMVNAPEAIKSSITIKNYGTSAAVYRALEEAGLIEAEDLEFSESTLQKSILNDYFKNGEIPDGCDVEPESEMFIIK